MPSDVFHFVVSGPGICIRILRYIQRRLHNKSITMNCLAIRLINDMSIQHYAFVFLPDLLSGLSVPWLSMALSSSRTALTHSSITSSPFRQDRSITPSRSMISLARRHLRFHNSSFLSTGRCTIGVSLDSLPPQLPLNRFVAYCAAAAGYEVKVRRGRGGGGPDFPLVLFDGGSLFESALGLCGLDELP